MKTGQILEMIIVVGFKVNSERALQFRKWVNQIQMAKLSRAWLWMISD